MNEIETEAHILRADLAALLIEMAHIGSPDPSPGPFVPDTEYDRLAMRRWETYFSLECIELHALNRAFLDRLRTVLAVREIIDKLSGKKTTNRQKLSHVELIGMTVSPGHFDEYALRLRRVHLEREFRTALRKAGEDVTCEP